MCQGSARSTPSWRRPPAVALITIIHRIWSVIALGHPSGLRGAVTLGVVSGKADLPICISSVPQVLAAGDADEDKPGGEGDTTVPYLVTDAALAGGMSGGPLLDPSGAMVGVSTFVRPEP